MEVFFYSASTYPKYNITLDAFLFENSKEILNTRVAFFRPNAINDSATDSCTSEFLSLMASKSDIKRSYIIDTN
jgi:hypothetical protein